MAVQAVPVPAKGGHKKFWAIVAASLGSLVVAVAVIGAQTAPTATKAPAVAAKAAPAKPSQASLVAAWSAAVMPDMQAFSDASSAFSKSDGTLADLRAREVTALGTSTSLLNTLRMHPAPAAVSVSAADFQKAVEMSVAGTAEAIRGIDAYDPAMIDHGSATITAATAILTRASNELTAEVAAL